MSRQVTIKPSNHTFTCGDDETVLAAALRASFTLPYGCRNGACGTCKGKILEGSVDYGNPQPYVLAEFERKAGLALFCQARPLTDLESKRARYAASVSLISGSYLAGCRKCSGLRRTLPY